MKTTSCKTMVIAGILIIITAVLVMLMRNVDGSICFDGFTPIFRNDIGSDDVKGLHNNTDSYYFNRRYLNIKVDSISYDCSNSKSCEVTEQNKGESESSQYARGCIQNLREYKKEDVVRCLDDLSIKKNRRPMHIAFVGDSTVRQHFFSFIRLIPDYDRKTVSNSTSFAEYAFHEDMNVTSHLLDNLRVSFYWRNLIRSDLIDDFRRWASSNNNETQAPDFILLGVTAHHLIANNNVSNSLKMYEKLLEDELVPLLKRSLAVHPLQEIIWLRQSLTIEQFSRYESQMAYGIYPDKIKKYNAIISRILKGTKVLMWDAINAIVEEYIRACTLIRYDRRDKHLYENCNDFIHPGFEALSLGTRILINHICYPSDSHNTQ